MSGGIDVAVFLPNLAGGGAQRVMLDVARALAARGDHVALVAASWQGAYAGERPAGVECIDLGRRRVLGAVLPLARWLRRRRPATLVATMAHANIAASVAVRLARTPTRVVLREANTPSLTARRNRKEAWTEAVARYAYRRADAVIAGSHGVANELLAGGVPSARLHVLGNPVDMAGIAAASARAPGHEWLSRDAGPPVVLAAGRLTRQKGFDTLLAAVARLQHQRPVHLVILGEGEDRAALESQASSLGLTDTCDFPGFVDNPYAWMARASVFVLSSRWEGLPNTLIQALACGCPCVSTDCPSGPDQILDGGRYGRLVPVDQPAALAAAIAATLGDPPDPEVLRQRAAIYDMGALIGRWREVLLGSADTVDAATT